MTENSNTPTPENNSPNAQSYGSYGSQSGASQNGGAYQQPYGAPTYGTPAGDPQQPGGKKPKNIVGSLPWRFLRLVLCWVSSPQQPSSAGFCSLPVS